MAKMKLVVCEGCGFQTADTLSNCSRCGGDKIPGKKLINPQLQWGTYGKDGTQLQWGTYGKDGTQPLKYKKLHECSSNHLNAILETQKQISFQYKRTIRHILEKREEHIMWKISIKDLPLYINFNWHTEKIKSLFKRRLSLGV